MTIRAVFATTFTHTDTPRLSAAALACRRGTRVLFQGLDLEVRPGRIVWVRGHNGSGKTSLLRLLAGLTRPAAGSVCWRGKPITELAEEFGRELLYIGHAPGLKDELSVAENLAFAAGLAGSAASSAQMEAALERVGMATRARLPARVLSQGQKRRAALARLALPDPAPLWLLDEPFAALDEDGIGSVRELMAAHLARGGIAVLTSHQEIPLQARNEQSLALGAA